MSKPEGHDEAVRRAAFLRGRIDGACRITDVPRITNASPFDCFLPAPRVFTNRKFLVHVLLPIFAATYIYTLWGSRSFIVFRLYENLGLGSAIVVLRKMADPLRHFIPSFILFSVPAALWLYAAIAVCLLFWAGRKVSIHRTGIRWLWIACPLALAAGSEIAQRFHIIPGTFDVYDLLAYATAALAAYTLLAKRMLPFSRRAMKRPV